MIAHSPRLPDNSVLLHVGPHKTGTTAIQGALFRARPQLAEHGVLHAGEDRHPVQAVVAFSDLKPRRGWDAPSMDAWQHLVGQVTAASDRRVIVSSEHFGAVDVETARRAVRELGGPRVHVVVTLRPLAKIMPSQWQQYVRNQATSSYDAWLDGMLNRPPYDRPTPSFWRRHRHDELVERWASVVGPEKVTVIVLDETDRDFLLRRFEELVGLPAGLLVAEKDTENRSLTLGEIELVRQVNVEFRRRGWSDQVYSKVVREGFVFRMQANRIPGADEPRITTPQWALDRAAEIGAAAAEKVSGLGVCIVGDISTLGARVLAVEPDEPARADILAVEAAREAVVGIVDIDLVTKATSVETTSARDLVGVILEGARRRARGAPSRAIP